ncbi:MAG: hypothetical protein LBF05_05060 [Tannerella sp.]|nr:hypothetical protein [Tannerella sp.]
MKTLPYPVPVEIADVEKFYFTNENSIMFTLKDGNTIELTDYQSAEFTINPAPVTTSSRRDLEKTCGRPKSGCI